MDTFRLATFNIKHGATARGNRGDPDAVAEACASLQADVLALQEVDHGVPRSGSTDLAAVAAEATGMKVVFAPAMRIGSGRYGNALLVRGDVMNHEVLMLKGPRWRRARRIARIPAGPEPRNVILATARVGGHRLSIAATHLDTRETISRTQLRQAVAKLQSLPEPWVLMGDLNRTSDDVLSEPLLRPMELVRGPHTFPAPNPMRSIDHLAVRGLVIRPDSVRAVRSARVSDHLALVCDVDMPTTPHQSSHTSERKSHSV